MRERLHRPWAAGFLVFALLLTGCGGTQQAAELHVQAAPVTYRVLTDSLAADPDMAALVAPYHEQMQDLVSEVIGEATSELVRGTPESLLGNMAADAMLDVIQGLVDQPVEMALTNNGGLRTTISAGPITTGAIYELMPFDNMAVVLDLSGAQVDTLAQQIAQAGGEPIAGFSFNIREGTAADIRVAGAPLDLAGRYRLVTSDYLANGGGRFTVLTRPLARKDTATLLRDVFIRYIRAQQTIAPRLDGRITLVQ